jgi:hypothetical protein
MPLQGLAGKHTFESFLDLVKVHHRNTNEEIRILAYVSNLTPERLFDSMKRFPTFNVTELGEIVEVRIERSSSSDSESKPREEESSDTETASAQTSTATSTYYCHFNRKRGLLLCFTTDTLEEAGRTMDRFVNHTNGIFPLWIHPITFDKIRREIQSKNPDSIISEFHAHRYKMNGEDVIRPNYEERYFKYMADDGRFTLDELSKAYGVLPTSILFNILNVCKFRITNMGRFAFAHGDLDFLFNIINEVLAKVLETKALIEKAKIEFIPVNMGKKEVKLPKVIPVDIVFSREIDFSEVERLVDNMSGEDFNFEIFDMLLMPGSIHLSGTIVDRNKNIGFNITGNSEKITLSPRKDTNFDSMMQFYKMITERLDLKAEIRASTIP